MKDEGKPWAISSLDPFLFLAHKTAPDGLFALLAHKTAPDGLFALLAHKTAPVLTLQQHLRAWAADGLFALSLSSFLSRCSA
jgi:hypothetical protein